VAYVWKAQKQARKTTNGALEGDTATSQEVTKNEDITQEDGRGKHKWGAIIIEFELLLQTNNLSHKPRSLEAAASPSCFMRVVTEKVVSLV
jgi:hypothetical protein